LKSAFHNSGLYTFNFKALNAIVPSAFPLFLVKEFIYSIVIGIISE